MAQGFDIMSRHLEMNPANLKALREEAHLSQSALAKLIHMSGSTRMSDWERGVHPINPACWELLLIKLGKHPVYGARKGRQSSD